MKTITVFVAGQLKNAEHTSDMALLPQGRLCWLSQANIKVCLQL